MATKIMQGTIDRISEKEWQDKVLYSFALKEERGWFRTGETPPPADEGNYVRFVVDTRKGNVDMGSIEVIEESAPTRAPRASGSSKQRSPTFPKKSSGAGVGSRDDYWKEKDAYYKEVEVPRITLSACQSRAIEVVKMALANEALSLGATKGKRLDNLLSIVDEVTDRFVDQINNIGTAKKAAKKVSAEEPFDDEIPFGDESDDAGWDD